MRYKDTQTNTSGCVPIKLFTKTASRQIYPTGSLLIPEYWMGSEAGLPKLNPNSVSYYVK